MQRPIDVRSLEQYVKNLCESHDLNPLRCWGDTLMELEHRGHAFDTKAILEAMADKLEAMAEPRRNHEQ